MTKRTAVAVVTLFVASVVMAHAQQRVTVVGCPVNGIAPKCLVIRGADNVTYNITDARQRPDIGGRAISVTGTRVNRDHYCRQGVVLANISWSYTNQSCR